MDGKIVPIIQRQLFVCSIARMEAKHLLMQGTYQESQKQVENWWKLSLPLLISPRKLVYAIVPDYASLTIKMGSMLKYVVCHCICNTHTANLLAKN